MKKISLIPLLSAICFLLSAKVAAAFCPVCTVAAASAVGLSRWIGVDDTISGLWLGALTVSATSWTISWMKSKQIKFWGSNFFIAVMYYALILIPFYKTDIISFHPKNMLWGTDKLLLGILIGSVLFILGHSVYIFLKKKNGGHAHFPYEKIVMPIAPTIIMTAIFYFITK